MEVESTIKLKLHGGILNGGNGKNNQALLNGGRLKSGKTKGWKWKE